MAASSHLIQRRLTLALCIFLSLALLLTSCAVKEKEADPLAYRDRAFCATLRGALAGAPFEGTLTHRLPTAGEESDTYLLTFTAPQALAGVTMTVCGKSTVLSLRGISVPTEGWDMLSWLRIPRLFAAGGSPLSITRSRETGEMTVVWQSEEGDAFTVWMDAASETPRMIESDGIWIEILSFAP